MASAAILSVGLLLGILASDELAYLGWALVAIGAPFTSLHARRFARAMASTRGSIASSYALQTPRDIQIVAALATVGAGIGALIFIAAAVRFDFDGEGAFWLIGATGPPVILGGVAALWRAYHPFAIVQADGFGLHVSDGRSFAWKDIHGMAFRPPVMLNPRLDVLLASGAIQRVPLPLPTWAEDLTPFFEVVNRHWNDPRAAA